MKKIATLLVLLASLVDHGAMAQNVISLCTQIPGSPNTSCQPVSKTSPMPMVAIGSAGATSGYVYTSNGPGLAATFKNYIVNLANQVTGTLPVTNGGNQQNGGYVNAKDAPYNADGNWHQLSGGIITSGTNAFNATTATFTLADVGKIITVYGAGTNGNALTTTIASYVDSHDVTLTANASTTTGASVYNAYLSGVTTTQSGAGSYAPNDTVTITTTGGTVASVFTVATTGLTSATANAVGSGGTNGACVLTGTTGAGNQKFQINATIAANAISAIGSVVTRGSYTTNPTSLTAEPVTSSCGLTGATLTLKMGIGNVSVATGGVYTSYPANPVAQASTSGAGTGATMNVNSKVSGYFEYGLDDTAALQAAINGTPNYGTLYIPFGLYRISSALTIANGNNINVKGEGAFNVTSLLSSQNNADIVDTVPYGAGTAIMQTTAATDVVDITASNAVNLYDFTIRFADQIRFTNTGHGINATPSDLVGGLPGNGVLWGSWARIQVFGTDGNHYAFNTVNQMYYNLDNLRAFGGGCLNKQTNSTGINYGNDTIRDLYCDFIQFGTANAINVAGNHSGTFGTENLNVFIRPQVNVETYNNALFRETTPVDNSTQYAYNDLTNAQNISLIQPDFEPPTAFVNHETNAGYVSPDGFMGTLATGYYTIMSGFSLGGTRNLTNEGVFSGTTSKVPTLTAQAGLGSSPPAITTSSGKGDFAVGLNFGTGTSPAAGNLIQVSFGAYRGPNYTVTCNPENAATAALGIYPVSVSAGTKTGGSYYIAATSAPTASQANTVYAVDCQVRLDF